MTYSAFDPRKAIRTAIKSADWIIDGQVEECISIVDKNGNPLYVPMFVQEEVAVECPPYPYIEISLLSIPAEPHNIRATVRKHTCLVSFDIKFTDDDNNDVTSFGKKVADAVVNQTRVHQCDIDGIYFLNVDNQGRLHIEYNCEDVIFHWIMEISATYTDLC
jgi:hypothetical protein